MMQTTLSLSLLLLVAGLAMGQNPVSRNPRVLEVESYLASKSSEYVRVRFPQIPILINVRVTPLRLAPTRTAQEIPDIALPFHSFAQDAPTDAWDDPSKTIHELLSYIQSIEVRISLPNSLKDEAIFELRDALYNNLGLIPGRDRVEFERKNWSMQQGSAIPLEIIYLAGAITFVFLFGMYLISRAAARTVQSRADGAAQAPPAPMPMLPPVNEGAKASTTPTNMQLSDSMKIEERLDVAIDKLISDEGFPELEDLIALERLAIEDPIMLGVILRFMDRETQEALFIRSRSPAWLEALTTKEGVPTIECLQFVQRLVYKHRKPDLKYWHEFLITLWRLDADLAAFMQDLGQNEALGTLAWMPTELSIPAAKRAFPGAWGILLRPDFKPDPLPENEVRSLLPQALSLKPYNDPATLIKYEHERGLLQFLKICSIDVERDIYTAARKDSSIRSVRPPFFPIFDASEETIRELKRQVPLREWGKALFNIDRSVRSKVLKNFTDREKYIIGEVISQCDRENTPAEEIGNSREFVGREYAKYLKKQNEMPVEFDDTEGSENNEQTSEEQAA